MGFKNGKVTGEPFLIRDGMRETFMMNWTNNGLACWKWVNIFDIFQMEADPITGEPVGKPVQLDYTPTGYNASPVWSPDGKKILSDRAYATEGSKQSLIILSVTGDSVKKINLSEKLPEKSEIYTPEWSPDGKKIVFSLHSQKSEVLLFKNVIPSKEK